VGGTFSYLEAPRVRWLGVGPFYESAIGGQPQAVGAWSELFVVADGRVTVRPTTDGTAEGDPLFSRMVGASFLPLTSQGLLGAGADDDPATGPATVVLVAQDPPGQPGVESITIEVSMVGADGDAIAAPDGSLVFVTMFGIPA